jgi:lysine-ketoglutarate reductase/saccharopine dehydrogenase-like protein (TIGR00300 family)
MEFSLPRYNPPDFSLPLFTNAPNVQTAVCTLNGVVPDQYHSTSIYPEYFKIDGNWTLAPESRMDCVVVLRDDRTPAVLEMRYVRAGDRVILGRKENGEEGIYLHTTGFVQKQENVYDQFAFRQGRSRETAYSRDYDNLYKLLNHEKKHGNVVWVLGPAFAFDFDSRHAMQNLVEHGFVHGILAGNALATHDLEAGIFHTALGQNIYTQKPEPLGHYHHLDLINMVRRSGSIPAFMQDHNIRDGIIYACVRQSVPFVLTGSIRDDGPLPEVIADVYDGQAAMRDLIKNATTLICLATQLHTIAAGNMTPSFRIVNGTVRPLYIYTVDISEFVVNKLLDRGSLSAISVITNVQDFIVTVAKGLGIE